MGRSQAGSTPARTRPTGAALPGGAERPQAADDAPGELHAVGPGRRTGAPDLQVIGVPGGGVGTAASPGPDALMSELDVFGFPVQIGKVQPPLLPSETLDRDRLLEWMAAKIHSRLILIVADAGYGKTTLLADWSRRTRVRVLWYRLDETDRDWVVFVNHVVAAGREIDPGFAPNTMSLIGELGAGMGDRASIVRTLVTEIRRWVTGGTALLLDDYHVVDEVPEVREIVRELALRGPDRLAVVISTRRTPLLPLARLRALGEVAELTTADLRFDRDEMERLFRDAYGHPLDADLLDDLARTTEGWAATLRLVESAVRGRSRDEVRAVIQSLSAKHGDLHDYLAEEVVGRMPGELQDFLERCSLLRVATPHLAAVAGGVSLGDARRLLDVTEEAGLLSRRGRTGQAGRLLHPLVRSFLEGRLIDAVGADGVAAIHARIAAAAEANSWWLASHHYAAAGRGDDVARVLSGSLEAILGSGGAQAAVELIAAGDVSSDGGWAQALLARSYIREGRVAPAREAARAALQASSRGDPTIPFRVALSTLTTVEYNAGQFRVAVGHAKRLREAAAGTVYEAIAESILAVANTMIDGSIPAAEGVLLRTASLASRLGHAHYFGISHLNLAWLGRATGDASRVLASARLSIEALAETSAGPEMDTVHTAAAWGLAHEGDLQAAQDEIDRALGSRFARGRFETLLESADVVGCYIDPMGGQSLVEEAEAIGAATEAERIYLRLYQAEAANRTGRPAEARRLLETIPPGQYTGYPGFYARVDLALATALLLTGSSDVSQALASAHQSAEGQGAAGIVRSVRLLETLHEARPTAARAVTALLSVEPGMVSANAEVILRCIGVLDSSGLEAVRAAASSNPSRWLLGLRELVRNGDMRARWAAGHILESSGDKSDVRGLRALSRELRGEFSAPSMGRELARRTADRVWVEDQGRVVIHIGDREVAGSEIRRKPLALLCYLLARPGLSATRDQVLDALWPDTDPDQAVNSLHQTVYFLRRVIEPSYSDDASPGYVNQDSELVWLDSGLIGSRSVRCKALLLELGPEPDVASVSQLAGQYRGKFALDFSYEDWASAHRESLHARYLEAMERAIASCTANGRANDAMLLARAILETDPTLDHVEASLVKIYRMLGAHAAAAEQYQHYTSVMRDELGTEPPPLDEL